MYFVAPWAFWVGSHGFLTPMSIAVPQSSWPVQLAPVEDILALPSGLRPPSLPKIARLIQRHAGRRRRRVLD
jgi:hypothetical protein